MNGWLYIGGEGDDALIADNQYSGGAMNGNTGQMLKTVKYDHWSGIGNLVHANDGENMLIACGGTT